MNGSPVRALAFRLPPGDDLRGRLAHLTVENDIGAGVILGAVGSLTVAQLRFAEQPGPARIDGPLEIVGLCGTIGAGRVHLHAIVSNETGDVLGGHVCDGCVVRTTCELVIGVLDTFVFERAPDPKTGHDELAVRQRAPNKITDATTT